MIDQIRASRLPSNMMQFAARGALQVPAAENIEILVHLARHNKVFGDLARMTLAGWDEKACLAVVSDPKTTQEVLEYFVSSDNVRPKLLPALLENPSVPDSAIAKLARSALRDIAEIILKSERACSRASIVEALRANPYVKKEEAAALANRPKPSAAPEPASKDEASKDGVELVNVESSEPGIESGPEDDNLPNDAEHEEAVSTYFRENAAEIAAEGEKRFQALGGVLELHALDDSPTQPTDVPEPATTPVPAVSATATAAKPALKPVIPPKNKAAERQNTLQKINALDVKGRIQLALKGNKEERSILIRDGTKVVALAVLEAPKLSDGEVEKFASQKNVLEAVLRQIPLKRRFMKNYIVVRNLVANPRAPLDIGLGLMKNLLTQDLKNISANKEVSETIRKLALKMYKQKVEAANKK